MNVNIEQNNAASRYSDQDLEEFRALIVGKIDAARIELDNLVASMGNQNSNGTEDTSAAYSTLEDGASTLEKETMHQMAGRQKKFIEQLEAALVRIEHKTYGICRVTGKLIPKERMRAVPHTTMSMEAKLRQY
jgi:RNA polymerase-binding transcription factor DksA